LLPALTTNRSPLTGFRAMFSGVFRTPAATGTIVVVVGPVAVAAFGMAVMVLSAWLDTQGPGKVVFQQVISSLMGLSGALA
jgi:hypothetical protein